ncbi:hypothetical protein IC232_04050 [Microvirga sp. BT688]|uniref:hypothetical protein n=1 Tax=Microvirga sp. TaxID=1873136 RepID=UPI00168A2456|nr:hypothetical protein [Microvirga sp.]MBD2745865.1 hypothetical protein [Microvirga sp.]
MFTIPEIQLCGLRIKAYKDRALKEHNNPKVGATRNMGNSLDDSIKSSVFRPIAVSGNLARLTDAVSAASDLLPGKYQRFDLDRLEEVFGDLPKFRAGFNLSGRVLEMKHGRNLRIAIATTEAMDEIPDAGACEMTVLVRDPAKCEDMMSLLNIGDLIEVRGKIVPFAYLEDKDEERVVSLTLVASHINVLETAQG